MPPVSEPFNNPDPLTRDQVIALVIGHLGGLIMFCESGATIEAIEYIAAERVHMVETHRQMYAMRASAQAQAGLGGASGDARA